MKLNRTFRAAALAIAPAALLALPAYAAPDAAQVVKHYAEVAHGDLLAFQEYLEIDGRQS